ARNGDECAWEKQFAADIVQESPVRIRFQLKTGIPWSDGFGELTADDVKFSYERIADPAIKSPYRVDWEKLDRVDVTGSHSGVVILKEPYMRLWESTRRSGFLDSESRQDLIELAREGSAPHRTWYRLYQDEGIEGLANIGYDGAVCRLTGAQQERL